MSNLYVVGLEGVNAIEGGGLMRLCKVGMTTRSVYKRIGDWDCGSPFKHIVLFDMQVFDAHALAQLERSVHHILRDHHVRLEWFMATNDMVLTAIWESCLDIGIDPVCGVKLHECADTWRSLWTDWQAKHIKAA